MQATSDPGSTIGTVVDGRNRLAIGTRHGAGSARAATAARALSPQGCGGLLRHFQLAGVPARPQPLRDGRGFEHPVFRDAARDQFEWSAVGKDPAAIASYLTLREIMHEQLGLFYPPQAYLIFYPFSRLPWFPALAFWTVFVTLAFLACGSLTWTFDLESQGRSPVVAALIIAAFLLNPITELHFANGQTTLIMCAGVALGQWARRRGYFWLAAFFWSFAAIKPQLGILLCGVTLFAGGWRFCVATALMTLGLNALGGLVTTGDPLMMLGMWKGGQSHVVNIVFNSAESVDVISWVRVVYVLTGNVIALTPVRNLAGIFFWMGLVLGAAWPRGGLRWALPYWLATAAAGSWCSDSRTLMTW